MAAAVFPGVLGWRAVAVAFLACVVAEGFRALHAPSTTWEGELQQQWARDSLARNGAQNLTCSSDMEERRGSRERFLEDHALGVGLGLAAGLSFEPQPGNALFGERKAVAVTVRRSGVCLLVVCFAMQVVFRASRRISR